MDFDPCDELLIGENEPLEEIRIEDRKEVPYVMVPFCSNEARDIYPTRIMGKTYEEEYHSCLDEHYKLAQTIHDLLWERKSLLKALQEPKPTSQSSQKTKEVHRNRRLASQIARHFSCPNCIKAYGSEGSLRQHLKTKHRIFNN